MRKCAALNGSFFLWAPNMWGVRRRCRPEDKAGQVTDISLFLTSKITILHFSIITAFFLFFYTRLKRFQKIILELVVVTFIDRIVMKNIICCVIHARLLTRDRSAVVRHHRLTYFVAVTRVLWIYVGRKIYYCSMLIINSITLALVVFQIHNKC